MRIGKPSISRGSQLGELAPSAPRLSLVPCEMVSADPAPVRVAQRIPPPALVPAASPSVPAVCPEYSIVHDRLTAIERLARLREQGALSPEEFEIEKSVVLGLPADDLVLHQPALPPSAERVRAKEAALPGPRPPAHSPSLIGRLFGWHLIPLGLAAGLGFSFATQPQETWRFFDEVIRLLGL